METFIGQKSDVDDELYATRDYCSVVNVLGKMAA
jgi:hypothetical protein